MYTEEQTTDEPSQWATNLVKKMIDKKNSPSKEENIEELMPHIKSACDILSAITQTIYDDTHDYVMSMNGMHSTYSPKYLVGKLTTKESFSEDSLTWNPRSLSIKNIGSLYMSVENGMPVFDITEKGEGPEIHIGLEEFTETIIDIIME